MMKRIGLMALAVLATGALASARQDAMSKEMASVQGAWVFNSANGQDLTAAGIEIVVTITGDKYTQTENGQVVERGSFKLDASKKPMTLDLMVTEGQDAGSTQLGILEVSGKSMRGKLNAPGATARPTDFELADGFFVFAATKR